MALLEAHDLTVCYFSDISILKGVSAAFQKGEITAVIGPNGAGKSTLLKSLYGLLKPKAGSIRLAGEEVTHLEAHQFLGRGVAYVPQLRSIFPELTVAENLELGAWIFKKDKRRVQEAMARVYERFPILAGKRTQAAGLLSGGQQKILEIARCLITDPTICLLDEPTATLSPKIAGQIYATLVTLRSEGITIVAVDQRVRQIFEVCDAIYVLELGQNKVNGTKAEFEGGLKELIKGWLD
jgi:branched-chain amino acid transport system ATP-binding protein